MRDQLHDPLMRCGGLSIAALLAIAMLCGCGKRAPEVAEETQAQAQGAHGGAIVSLPAAAIAESHIGVDTAGTHMIEVTLEIPGEVKLNSERAVQVRPTYPGVVRTLRKRLGDPVRAGEVLAIIHSNESLSDYALQAPMSGQVVGRDVAEGQSVDGQSVLYSLADLSKVWVDFPIYSQSIGAVRVGQRVRIRSESGSAHMALAGVSYVGPLLDQDTRTAYGRVVLDNRDGRWQPGLLVTAIVTTERVTARIAVPEEAIVRMGEGSAVFRAVSDTSFEVQAVTTGRTDGTMTEIVSGLDRGARIVVRNTFLLKAELGKSEGGDED